MKTVEIEWNKYPWGYAMYFPPLPRTGLISNGLAADYMFEQMGEQNSRVGPTEHGDKFRLVRKSCDRFVLTLYLYREAKNTFQMRAVDPYQTDISDILERLGGAS